MNGRHEIESRHEQIAEICREHGVARLPVFGSTPRDDFDSEKSDIDFLVEFKAGVDRVWLAEDAALRAGLASLFGRKLDVVPAKIRRNPDCKAVVEAEQELLYAA
jgi:hypothetical protein